jgi:dienelactone hydrolase
VNERVVTFGRDGGLVGVLAEPSADAAIQDAPAVLMWNVGIQHRVGPYRFQVDLARELARRGYASLRFDLSGMGDSEASQDARDDMERALADLAESMDLLRRRRGARAFVPVGFCSSVDIAHAFALSNEAVVGACFLEGYAFRTVGFWLRRPLRFFSPERWRRYLALRLPHRFGVGAEMAADPMSEEQNALGPIFSRHYPTRERFSSEVRTMAKRGTRLLFVYVGGDTDMNHAGQFAEMTGLRRMPGVEVEFYRGADHTFYRVGDRRRAVVRVADWMSRQFTSRGLAAEQAAWQIGGS